MANGTKTPRNSDDTKAPVFYLDLENQLDLKSRYIQETPYVSASILDPVITIERHGGKYHIAARFNLETTILDYHTKKSDGHELYFHDICLRYRNRAKEELVMKPESSEAGAFNVTNATSTSINPTTDVNLGPSPTSNVSLGLTRSTGLAVQYNVDSWTTSAHRVAIRQSPPHQKKSSTGRRPRSHKTEDQYQWFWEGNQEETKKLTPDQKNSVKRHIVVRRVIPIQNFPTTRVETAKMYRLAKIEENNANGFDSKARIKTARAKSRADDARDADHKSYPPLRELLRFDFSIQVRVKRRYGRLHRLMVLSFNQMKSSFVQPTFTTKFSIKPKGRVNYDRIPLAETHNIATTLDSIKEKHLGEWDKLQGQHVVDMDGYTKFLESDTMEPTFKEKLRSEEVTREIFRRGQVAKETVLAKLLPTRSRYDFR